MPARSAFRRAAAAALFAVTLVTVAACEPAPRPAPAPTGRLLFAEEFDGTRLDTSRWHPNRWFASRCAAGATPGETAWYRPGNVAVRGGHLVLTARAGSNDCREGTWSGTKPYSSGWVQTGGSRTETGTTQPGFTFRYGRVDVRFKAPRGAGLWPAVWLLSAGEPGTGGTRPYPSRPEIDMLELYQQDPSLWKFNVHLDGVDAGARFRGPDTASGFHVISLDWRPGKLTYFVDGVLRWTYTGPKVPSVPMYLVLNLATGGSAGPSPASAFPAELLVDHVRVYA